MGVVTGVEMMLVAVAGGTLEEIPDGETGEVEITGLDDTALVPGCGFPGS